MKLKDYFISFDLIYFYFKFLDGFRLFFCHLLEARREATSILVEVISFQF